MAPAADTALTGNFVGTLGIPTYPSADLATSVGSYNWIDLALSFDINKQMTFWLAANNLFDRDAPLIPDSRSRIGLLRSNTVMR